MNNLLQAKKRTNNEESRIRINERIANKQATLANELEMKEKATQLRKNNFSKPILEKWSRLLLTALERKSKAKILKILQQGGAGGR